MQRNAAGPVLARAEFLLPIAVVVLLLGAVPVASGGAAPGPGSPRREGSLERSIARPITDLPPAVLNQSTLVLFNNTHVPGAFDAVSSSLPSLEAFDAKNREVFVEGFYSGVIDVVSAKTNEVTATISAGQFPNTLAYDAWNNNIYFGQQTNDLVSVANASTNLVQRSVDIGFEPLAMVADPVTGNLFVTGWNTTGTAFVAVLSGTNGTVTTTFPFGANRFPVAGPDGLAYDPTNAEFYVPSIVGGSPGARGNLTILNGSIPSVVGNVSLAFNPDAIAYSPSTGDFYLGNQTGSNLSVFDPGTASVVATVALPNTPSLLVAGAVSQHRLYVGTDGNVSVVSTKTNKVLSTFPIQREPSGLALDTLDGNLYISDYVGNNVSLVNTTNDKTIGSILLGASPYNLAFDPTNGELYVGDLESSQLIVLNGTTNRVGGFVPLGATPYGVAYDPVTNEVFVDDFYSGNVSVVDTATNSVVGYLPAGTNPWGIAYDGANHDIYVTNVGSNNITVLDPATKTVAATLNFSTPPGAIAYDAKSSTLFVGEYNVGNVSVLNATSNALIRNTSTGSEPYTIAVDPHDGDAFVGNYASDNITVLGPRGQELNRSAAAGVGVFGSAYDPVDGDVYVASFSTDTITTVNGSSGLGVGGYTVGVGPVAVAVNPVTGTVYVANYDSGSLTLLTVPPPPRVFSVTFAETGVPHGKTWAVGFNGGALQRTTATSLTFSVPNGSYAYLITGPSGFVVTAPSPFGVLVVSGSNLSRTVTFAAGSTFSLTFHETGLGHGTTWCVTVGAKFCATTANVVLRNLTNGTYPFHVVPVPGLPSTPSSGTVSVAGVAVRVTVKFT
jgi:YVTN family beta-propeller protein